MRSLLVFGLLVSVISFAGCSRSRSSCCEVRRAPTPAPTAYATPVAPRSEPTTVTYISKPAPDQRSVSTPRTYPAPPPPGADPCCDPCKPRCKPLCNPLGKLLCNPFCIGGG